MFRSYITESGLLENPHKELPLISIDGEILHPDLVNFYFQCKDNYLACRSDSECELKPVFVTFVVGESWTTTTGQLQKCKINAKK